MKKLFITLVIFVLTLVTNFKIFSQAGSVELQDGGGIFISSHASIEEAYNAIPGTISQAYIIEILVAYNGASELFPIDLTVRTGSSPTNTITIRPDAGNVGEIISGNNANGIINIDGGDYIIIDGRPGGIGSAPDLLINNTATTGTSANTIALFNGSTNCIIRYCFLLNGTAAGLGSRTIEFGVAAANPEGNSDHLVEICNIVGGRAGIGSDGTNANPNRNIVIRNNNITDWGFAGIWFLTGSGGMTIDGNTIYNTSGVNTTTVAAIMMQSSVDGYNLLIRNNKITNVVSTSTSTGLSIRGIYTSTAPGLGSVINIYNNFVSLPSNNNNASVTFGIYTSGTAEDYTCNIYYNTVLIGGIQSGGVANRIVSAGIVKQSTVAGIVYNQRNNISINTRTGGTSGVIHTGCAINGVTPNMNIDYNCYFATGTNDALNGYPAMWDSVGYYSLTDYKTAAFPNEQNSRFKNVTFVSNSDLHLAGASIGDPDLSSRPIAGITTDIDGALRSTTFPYKGADESTAFSLSTLNLAINFEACPETDTIHAELRNTTAPYDLVEVSRGLGGQGISRPVNFAKAVNGVSYYIVVRHRNSIETWSKTGGEVFTAGSLTYDFTTAASQAFGNNMVLVGSDYSIYTGDVQQDGTADLSDIVLIFNDAALFAGGYVLTDLNCDDFVDLSDIVYAFNNSSLFVSVIRP